MIDGTDEQVEPRLVTVATRSLDRELDTAFEGFDEGERSARRAMADLESDITRRLLDLDRDAIF